MRVMISWSGGKESALALYRAKAAGHVPICLLNCVDSEADRGMSHGIPSGVIAAQAEALGLPIRQPRVTWDTYEEIFKATVREMKAEHRIEGGVFGDIDIEEHRQWVERICEEVGIIPVLPLWGAEREKLLHELIGLGFQAILVNARAELLGPEWMGRQLDAVSLDELRERALDLCGENGEYHTLVVVGPLFRRRLVLKETAVSRRDDRFFLEVAQFSLEPCEAKECAPS
jgi:uncharacterized protein (TIGR00290 family)